VIRNIEQVVKQVKNALIFGGARGIGRIVAGAFVAKGFAVTIAARTGAQVAETVKRLSLQGDVLGCQGDVSIYSEVKETIDRHLSIFKCLDILINTAAVQGPIGLSWENDPMEWAQNISVNLVGSFNICRAVLPIMREKNRGILIFFSGGGAAYARPHFSAYGASKTGVLRLVETINEEIKEDGAQGVHSEPKGVRIYAVAPGAVKTRMTEEVLAYPNEAGEKALKEALKTQQDGGVSLEKVAELCLYLGTEQPLCLSGKLIHVNEPYREYVERYEGKEIGDSGLLRRVSYK